MKVVRSQGATARKIRVHVRGPHGFSRVIKKTTTFTHARPGIYRINAPAAKAKTGTAYARLSRHKTKVTRSKGSLVTVTYGTVVSAKTKVVPPAAVDRVSGPADGTRTLVVSGATSYAVGNYLVSGPSASAPDGLLTRITARARNGTTTTYTVVPATLPQVIPQGDVKQSVTTPINSATDDGTAERVSTSGPRARESISDSAGCSTSAQVSLTRTLTAGITLDIDGSWSALHPSGSYLRATAGASASATLKAVAVAAASCNSGRHQLGKTINLPKITFAIGPVPVVIAPTLKFYADATAQVGGAINATAGLTTTANAWVQGTLGGSVTTGVTPPRPTFTHTVTAGDGITASATASLSAQLTADLYGLAGPYVTLDVSPKISVTPTKTPWVSLDADFSLDVGLVLDKCVSVWGARLCAEFDLHKDGLIKKTWPIWHSNAAPPTGGGSTTGPGGGTGGGTGMTTQPGTWSSNYQPVAWAHDSAGHGYPYGTTLTALYPDGSHVAYSQKCGPACWQGGTNTLNTLTNADASYASSFASTGVVAPNGAYAATYDCTVVNQAGTQLWKATVPSWISSPTCGPIAVSNAGNRLVFYVQGVSSDGETYTWLFTQARGASTATQLTEVPNPWSFNASMSGDGTAIVWKDDCLGGCSTNVRYLNTVTGERRDVAADGGGESGILSDDGKRILLTDFFGSEVTLVQTADWSQQTFSNFNLAGWSANLQYLIRYEGDFSCPTGYDRYDVTASATEPVFTTSDCHSLGVFGQDPPLIADDGSTVAFSESADLAEGDTNGYKDVYVLKRQGS